MTIVSTGVDADGPDGGDADGPDGGDDGEPNGGDDGEPDGDADGAGGSSDGPGSIDGSSVGGTVGT